MKKLLIAVALLMPVLAQADFSESATPTGVYLLPCDSNPRIVVTFQSPTASIWYPANGTFAKEFLAISLAAKASSSPLYFYGSGDANNLTPYCIGVGQARQVIVVGAE